MLFHLVPPKIRSRLLGHKTVGSSGYSHYFLLVQLWFTHVHIHWFIHHGLLMFWKWNQLLEKEGGSVIKKKDLRFWSLIPLAFFNLGCHIVAAGANGTKESGTFPPPPQNLHGSPCTICSHLPDLQQNQRSWLCLHL